MGRSANDIEVLRNDQDHTYDLVANNGDISYTVKQKDGTINIQGPNDALHIHEIRHVADHLSDANGLTFDPNTGILGSLRSLGADYNEAVFGILLFPRIIRKRV